MVNHQAQFLYIPFLLLSIMATVIASQAMISGMFSIVYQGITTRIMPMFKVDYTSEERHSQIYIGFVNWFLLVAVLYIIFDFKESSKLAAAYGFAVTGTMSLTGIFMTWIFHPAAGVREGGPVRARHRSSASPTSCRTSTRSPTAASGPSSSPPSRFRSSCSIAPVSAGSITRSSRCRSTCSC